MNTLVSYHANNCLRCQFLSSSSQWSLFAIVLQIYLAQFKCLMYNKISGRDHSVMSDTDIRGSPIGFFTPAIPTKIFSQSRNPDGLYQPISISIIQFFLSPFPKFRGPFRWGMIFRVTSIDPLKSIVTVRREFGFVN